MEVALAAHGAAAPVAVADRRQRRHSWRRFQALAQVTWAEAATQAGAVDVGGSEDWAVAR